MSARSLVPERHRPPTLSSPSSPRTSSRRSLRLLVLAITALILGSTNPADSATKPTKRVTKRKVPKKTASASLASQGPAQAPTTSVPAVVTPPSITTTIIASTSTAPAPITTITATTITATTITATTIPAATQSLTWVPCGTKFQCAQVNVPLDYSNPASRTIGIGLRKLPATNQVERLGSILLNPGGPGGSGISMVNSRSNILGSAMERYDLIGFDVRGLAGSTPLPCASAQQRETATRADYIAAIREACDTRVPGFRQTISTANTARDMDRIREALGEAKLNYLGISYGTYLGLVYADLFPDRVGRFVIDSAVDPTLRALQIQQGQYTQYEANLTRALGRCRAPACPFADPDVGGRFDRLMDKLEANPVVVNGESASAVAVLNVSRLLFERSGGEALFYRVLRDLERGDGSSITEVVRLLDRIPQADDFRERVDSDGVYAQIACTEGFHPTSSPDFANYEAFVSAKAPRYRRLARAQAYSQYCPAWDQTTMSDARPIPVAKPGLPPMLFVASRFDRVTPMVWTEAVSAKWPGALLRVSSFDHGAVPDVNCAREAAAKFFLTGTLPTAAACP